MKIYTKQPIKLVKFLHNGYAPYQLCGYDDLDLNNLPSRKYSKFFGFKVENCKYGYHAVPIEGIQFWGDLKLDAYLVEVSGVLDVDFIGKYDEIEGNNIKLSCQNMKFISLLEPKYSALITNRYIANIITKAKAAGVANYDDLLTLKDRPNIFNLFGLNKRLIVEKIQWQK